MTAKKLTKLISMCDKGWQENADYGDLIISGLFRMRQDHFKRVNAKQNVWRIANFAINEMKQYLAYFSEEFKNTNWYNITDEQLNDCIEYNAWESQDNAAVKAMKSRDCELINNFIKSMTLPLSGNIML